MLLFFASGRRFATAARPVDVAGERRIWKVHVGVGRVVFRSGVVGNLFAGQTAVLRLLQRRGNYYIILPYISRLPRAPSAAAKLLQEKHLLFIIRT